LEKKKLNYEYYLLLGNDVICIKDTLKELVEVIEKDKKIGMVSPTVLDKNKIIDMCGGTMSLFTGRANGFMHGEYYKKSKKIYKAFWLCTCCALIRSKLLKEVNYNDDYYGYFDDVGIGWKIFNKGFEVVSTLKTYIIHLGSMSFKKIPIKKTYLLERNRIIMFWQNLTLIMFLIFIPFVFVSRIICLSILFLIRKYDGEQLHHSILGLLDGFKEMKKFRKYKHSKFNDIKVFLNSTEIVDYE
jgi:GT2 family glycosyltransferase